MAESSYIRSITPVQRGNEWQVRVRIYGATERYYGSGARYSLHQAQMFADSIRRDIRNHGAAVLDTL